MIRDTTSTGCDPVTSNAQNNPLLPTGASRGTAIRISNSSAPPAAIGAAPAQFNWYASVPPAGATIIATTGHRPNPSSRVADKFRISTPNATTSPRRPCNSAARPGNAPTVAETRTSLNAPGVTNAAG